VLEKYISGNSGQGRIRDTPDPKPPPQARPRSYPISALEWNDLLNKLFRHKGLLQENETHLSIIR
jgi:hypothetical protein